MYIIDTLSNPIEDTRLSCVQIVVLRKEKKDLHKLM